jgi:hypothetical protein
MLGYFNDDGQVAVLYSPGYGCGWSNTYNNRHEGLLFHPEIVQRVLDGDRDLITQEWLEELGFSNVYIGGVSQLEIFWLSPGERFLVTEFDGFEEITTISDFDLTVPICSETTYCEDEQVAVLISPDWGSGWYTSNGRNESLLFHPKIVQRVLDGDRDLITQEWLEELGFSNVYTEGVSQLEITWLSPGERFLITEHNGSEEITTVSDLETTAPSLPVS